MTHSPLILSIDDDPDLVQIFRETFERKGFRFLGAKNGREGVAFAVKEHPDLILLDLRMPDMDGAEAITEMRKHPELQNTKVIILTNFNEFGGLQIDEEFCRRIGAQGFFPKERNLGEMVSCVRDVLVKEQGGT